jgi:excisionase family DNA binding protein
MSDDLLTTAEAARMLRVSQKTIGRWVRLGQLPAVRLPSGQLRIKRAEVDRLLASDQPPPE